MKGIIIDKKKLAYSYKQLLNKKNPLDKQILKLAKKGELKVGIVKVKEAPNLLL